MNAEKRKSDQTTSTGEEGTSMSDLFWSDQPVPYPPPTYGEGATLRDALGISDTGSGRTTYEEGATLRDALGISDTGSDRTTEGTGLLDRSTIPILEGTPDQTEPPQDPLEQAINQLTELTETTNELNNRLANLEHAVLAGQLKDWEQAAYQLEDFKQRFNQLGTYLKRLEEKTDNLTRLVQAVYRLEDLMQWGNYLNDLLQSGEAEKLLKAAKHIDDILGYLLNSPGFDSDIKRLTEMMDKHKKEVENTLANFVLFENFLQREKALLYMCQVNKELRYELINMCYKNQEKILTEYRRLAQSRQTFDQHLYDKIKQLHNEVRPLTYMPHPPQKPFWKKLLMGFGGVLIVAVDAGPGMLLPPPVGAVSGAVGSGLISTAIAEWHS